MNQSIKQIKNTVHPEASRVREQVKALNVVLGAAQLLLIVFGFIIGAAMAAHLSEYAEHYGGSDNVVDYTVNFFGYHLEVESDSFLGSPFMMFLFVSAGFDLVAMLLSAVRIYMRSMLLAKAEMLDTAYKTELLTVLLAMQSKNAGETAETDEELAEFTENSSESSVDAFVQAIEESVENEQEAYQVNATTADEDYVFCRYCGKKQRANRAVCWSCGLEISTPSEKN